MNKPIVDLSTHKNPEDLNKGRNIFIIIIWHFINILFIWNPLNPSSYIKTITLRAFGAKIGSGVYFKTGISIKSPWFLEISDYCLIGENVWIDSLAPIKIGKNSCISQGAYLCCGNHDWSSPTFTKFVRPITIDEGSWIGAKAIIMPGVHIKTHSVITSGSVLTKSTDPYTIYSGNPAKEIKKRMIKPTHES